MIEFRKKCLPFTIGLFLSISSVLFMIEFIRGIDFVDIEYSLEVLPYLCAAILCGLIGYPLCLYGINKINS